MWFDGQRQPNTLYIASTSRGKDSTAMLRAIQLMGWPLDMICSVDIWFDADTPAELPPMVAFKDEYDAKVLDWFGVPVTRLCVAENGKQLSYCSLFYKLVYSEQYGWHEKGFPNQLFSWCKLLKDQTDGRYSFIPEISEQSVVHYIGIAADEPNRFHNLTGMKLSPLVEIGWTESDCRAWCEANGLLSPIYTNSARGGCWFCHNQGVQQLRQLRHDYPDLWALLLRWDADSPVTFHADGHTVHDFDRRFALEDEGLINKDEPFRWTMLDSELNYRFEGF